MIKLFSVKVRPTALQEALSRDEARMDPLVLTFLPRPPRIAGEAKEGRRGRCQRQGREAICRGAPSAEG